MKKLCIILGVLLVLLAVRFYVYYENSPKLEDGQRLSFQTTLLSDSKLKGASQRFSTRYENSERIFITTSRFPVYSYGQKLLIDGELEVVELEGGGGIYTMSFPAISVLPEKNPVIVLSKQIRTQVTRVFSEYLPFPQSSLLVGIVFGIKEGMPEDLTDALTQTGIIHITAASGMNITLLAGAVFMIFGTLCKRNSAILISLGGLWVYAVVAGLDASIVRASIMASIAFSAALIGRQNTGWYALFLTGVVMVLLSPQTIFDIGFQLSLGSTAGILFLVPIMQNGKALKTTELWFLSDDFKATTAAQVATIPILLSAFGSYGLLSIPVNLVVLWTIPFLMILGGLAAVLSFILPILAVPFLYLSLPFLVYIQYVVMLASEFSPTLQVESLPFPLTLGYYLLLISLTLYLYRRQADRE